MIKLHITNREEKMKKLFKGAMASVALATCAFGLTACGEKDNKTTVEPKDSYNAIFTEISNTVQGMSNVVTGETKDGKMKLVMDLGISYAQSDLASGINVDFEANFRAVVQACGGDVSKLVAWVGMQQGNEYKRLLAAYLSSQVEYTEVKDAETNWEANHTLYFTKSANDVYTLVGEDDTYSATTTYYEANITLGADLLASLKEIESYELISSTVAPNDWGIGEYYQNILCYEHAISTYSEELTYYISDSNEYKQATITQDIIDNWETVYENYYCNPGYEYEIVNPDCVYQANTYYKKLFDVKEFVEGIIGENESVDGIVGLLLDGKLRVKETLNLIDVKNALSGLIDSGDGSGEQPIPDQGTTDTSAIEVIKNLQNMTYDEFIALINADNDLTISASSENGNMSLVIKDEQVKLTITKTSDDKIVVDFNINVQNVASSNVINITLTISATNEFDESYLASSTEFANVETFTFSQIFELIFGSSTNQTAEIEG